MTGGAHRGCTGRVTVGPTQDGVVYVKIRVSPSQQALITVWVEDVVLLEARSRRHGQARRG